MEGMYGGGTLPPDTLGTKRQQKCLIVGLGT